MVINNFDVILKVYHKKIYEQYFGPLVTSPDFFCTFVNTRNIRILEKYKYNNIEKLTV